MFIYKLICKRGMKEEKLSHPVGQRKMLPSLWIVQLKICELLTGMRKGLGTRSRAGAC